MSKFSEDWLKRLHCALWVMGEADVWTVHRILYEASVKGLFETDEWMWLGRSPRSAEVDAALALLELSEIIRREEDVIKVYKPPVENCDSYGLVVFIRDSLRRAT